MPPEGKSSMPSATHLRLPRTLPTSIPSSFQNFLPQLLSILQKDQNMFLL